MGRRYKLLTEAEVLFKKGTKFTNGYYPDIIFESTGEIIEYALGKDVDFTYIQMNVTPVNVIDPDTSKSMILDNFSVYADGCWQDIIKNN